MKFDWVTRRIFFSSSGVLPRIISPQKRTCEHHQKSCSPSAKHKFSLDSENSENRDIWIESAKMTAALIRENTDSIGSLTVVIIISCMRHDGSGNLERYTEQVSESIWTEKVGKSILQIDVHFPMMTGCGGYCLRCARHSAAFEAVVNGAPVEWDSIQCILQIVQQKAYRTGWWSFFWTRWISQR